MIKLIGGSDGGQGSIREGDSTINPFPQMRYFSAPSSVGVRIFNRGLHLLKKIAKAPIFVNDVISVNIYFRQSEKDLFVTCHLR